MEVAFFHVSSSFNRESIARHGLDWRRMGDEPGIAGGAAPEQKGVFLARDADEAEWFVSIGKDHHVALDVWAVRLELPEREAEDPRCREFDGFLCWMEAIPPDRMRLAAENV